jgi:hypothetical protein
MGSNPSSFAWRETDGRFVLRVRFKAAEEAVVFAVHFAGYVLGHRCDGRDKRLGRDNNAVVVEGDGNVTSRMFLLTES